ncbi:MAG: DinB family protein [Candidatus Dormibacteraeota bacterium]|uniref:DinB family protein n=1 Tax=Candidatus Dormiibacter inghamiae TaxID=3127013 RepID=A0A934KDN4_9BACT|nr:DinB family protein [Candidatus Dormibacteraeota bacterium]MBJ7606682.1 DinB family protein [Candidatus Dormibacteraeota bacterium]
MIDFGPYRRKEKTLRELSQGLDRNDLKQLTDEIVDQQLELIAEVQDEDVVFVPNDPQADDTFAAAEAKRNLAWTLGHVIVHATASSEEGNAHALELARGVQIVLGARSRSEVPWEQMTTVQLLRQRLTESRRMRQEMLDAWPDAPDLLNEYKSRPESRGQNALDRFLSSLSHEEGHLAQIAEIVRQARAARSSVQPSAI